MSVEIRKVETGQDEGGKPLYEYQLGGEVDGGFVPFVTKGAGYVEHLAERAKSEQEAKPDASWSEGKGEDES